MEPSNETKDDNGNIKSRLSKDYHVSFKENFAVIIEVESYKEYNILNNKNEYLNNYEDENEEDEDNEENEGKFDINKYNQLKLEKMANHDPNAFSKTKCIII